MSIVKAEWSISVSKKENVDYTKWQRDYFDALPDGEFMKGAGEYGGRTSMTAWVLRFDERGCHMLLPE